MARIALDAMGGDFAPRATVAGALSALADLDPSHVIQLVGRGDAIREQLDTLLAARSPGFSGVRERLEVVEASDVIEMADRPSVAIRGKPNSSMVVGLRLQTEGKSDAFVSAGNTGAQMAASVVLLKLHAGLSRPAIATVFPTTQHPVVVLDSGANVDCSPQELVQFARLGVVFAEDVLGRPDPGVGLLSIGEEPEKGNAVVKEAHQLLRDAGVNFRGNAEGRDILKGANDHGTLDVVVCDGFVGNVVLKFYESVAPLLIGALVRSGFDEEKLTHALRHIDSDAVGGAPLLGVRGVSIICHGKSTPRAIQNAIVGAAQAVENRMDEHIGRRLGGAVRPEVTPS